MGNQSDCIRLTIRRIPYYSHFIGNKSRLCFNFSNEFVAKVVMIVERNADHYRFRKIIPLEHFLG